MIQSNLTSSNAINTTPDFVYVPPQALPINNENTKNLYSSYIAKFKSAVYAFLLFLLLSSSSAYKILDIVMKLFSNNIEVIDEECMEPVLLGRIIMAGLMALVIFIL